MWSASYANDKNYDGEYYRDINFLPGGISHTITSKSSANGKIELWDSGKLNEGNKLMSTSSERIFDIPNGKEVTYKLIPDSGYILKKLTVNGIEVNFTDNGDYYTYTFDKDTTKDKVLIAVWGIRSEDPVVIDNPKNQNQYNSCVAIVKKDDISNYDILAAGGVYRGGNAKSIYEHFDANTTEYVLDNDPNDFSSILPYGNIYIDTSKLDWSNKDNFIIDIKDKEHFRWIGNESLRDLEDHKPYENVEKVVNSNSSAIAYYGYLHSYLNYGESMSNLAATSQNRYNGIYNNINVINGTNTVQASTGDYLYQIIYKDAAILSDGTTADLIIKVTKVELESTITTSDKVYIGIQGENSMQNVSNYIDKQGNLYIPKFSTVTYVRNSQTKTQQIRNAVGGNTTFTIQIRKSDGTKVEGSIPYAMRDLDIASYESFWGRLPSDGDWKTGTSWYKYGEGFEIIDGALSFAATPKYNHANEINAVKKGKIPIDIVLGLLDSSKSKYNSPLRIEGISSDNKTANGVRFVTSSTQKNRDNNGQFSSLGYYYSGTGYGSSNTYSNDNLLTMTKENWSAIRQDGNTFDTGFSVLLDTNETMLKWSGSQQAGTSAIVDTTLFDESLFTVIDQTHGTGGGLYIETYDIMNKCSPKLMEGRVVVPIESDVVVTLVPEDGYRVSKFTVNGKEYKLSDYFGNENTTSINIPNTNISVTRNSDETYDVTLFNVTEKTNIHVDFETDYYFTSVWKYETDPEKIPNELQLYIRSYTYKNGALIKHKDDKLVTIKEEDVEVVVDGEDTIWKIKYPSSGDSTKNWPELPIEDLSNHSTTKNHVNRVYYFAKEKDLRGNWDIQRVDNSEIITPGIISDIKYKDTEFRSLAVENYNDIDKLIKEKDSEKEAFISPLKGGILYNVQVSDLTINQIVRGNDADKSRQFDVTVKILDRNNEIIKGNFEVIKNGISETVISTAEGILLNLKHNDIVIIKNILNDSNYEIIQKDTEYIEFYKINEVDGKVIKEETEGLIVNGTLNIEQIVTLINQKDLPIVPNTVDNIKKQIALLLFSFIFIVILLIPLIKKLKK